jgi:hypothetical protein
MQAVASIDNKARGADAEEGMPANGCRRSNEAMFACQGNV